MKRVLVTGAGGYMGNILVGQLLQEGHEVIALDRFFFGIDVLDPYRDKHGLRVLKKDIRDVDVNDFDGVEAVFDLAAFSNDPSGELDHELTREVNHRGRAHVCATAKKAGVKRYMLSSSCSVYGAAGAEPCTEESPINPLTVYADCNRQAEISAFDNASDKFAVTALRFSTLFGLSRRMRLDLVINYMSYIAVTKRRIEVTGGGQQWRPLLHVRDAVRAFRTLMAAPDDVVNGKFFNVGCTNVQIWQLAEIVKNKLLFDVEIVVIPGAVDKRDYKVNFDKIKNTLGFEPQIDEIRGFDEVTAALLEGRIKPNTKTLTVDWYKHLLEAQTLVNEISLNGRYLR